MSRHKRITNNTGIWRILRGNGLTEVLDENSEHILTT